MLTNLIVLAAVACTAQAVAAQTAAELESMLPGFERPALWFGDQAPEIDGLDMLRGPEFDLASGVHVLDFWATWCGPCIAGFGHVSDLDDEYPEVNVVGVNVWERATGDALRAQIESFVAKQGDRMRFDVALTAPGAADTWVAASQLPGIPASFIVVDGRVTWLGHPDDIDEALAQIDAGEYNESETAAAAESAAKSRQRQAFMLNTFRSGDNKTGVALASHIADKDLAGLPDELGAMIRSILSDRDIDASAPVIRTFALSRAKPLAESHGSVSSIHFDTLALAYVAAGDLDKAIEAQRRAIASDTDPKNIGWYEARLANLEERRGG